MPGFLEEFFPEVLQQVDTTNTDAGRDAGKLLYFLVLSKAVVQLVHSA